MPLQTWFRPSRASSRMTGRRPRLGLLPLETRDVPALGLGSALGLGNDVNGSMAIDVAADAAGNSYITGNLSGTIDFDPANVHAGDADILTSPGGTAGYVAKYAPSGALLWARRMGGSAIDSSMAEGRAINVDAAGSVFVAGQFRGTGDFGPFTLTAAGSGKDAWVAKLNTSGTVLWANRWGRTDAGTFDGEIPQDLDNDAAGNVYVMSAKFGSAAGYDILKYSAGGTLQWADSFANNHQGGSCGVTADAAGNVYVSGAFYGTVDFDPGAAQKLVSAGTGAYSGFVLKLTTAGKFGWVTPFVGQSLQVNGTWTYGYSQAQRVTLGTDGNVIVGGWYGNKVDFNPGSGTTNLPTVGGGFIVKLSAANGSLNWAKAMEAAPSSYVFVYGLTTDYAGNIYATGSFTGTMDFNPDAGIASRTSAGSSDIYVLKLSSAGSFTWAETFGGAGSDIGFGIAVDSSNTVHLAGYFAGTVDFDPNPLANSDLTALPGRTWSYLVRLTQN